MYTHTLGIWPFDFIGGSELIPILIVAVILFGKRLPDLGRMIGKTLVNFKQGVNEMKDEIHSASEKPAPQNTPEPESTVQSDSEPQPTKPTDDRRNDSLLPE